MPACAEAIDAKILEVGPENVAAFIGEPVQGAGGVIIPPANYWPQVESICRKYGILLICDEVICGFGRTGNYWGSQTMGITPDSKCVRDCVKTDPKKWKYALLVGNEM